jgi:peptidoglycan/LPS O-acetylase OafA/YrhL
VPLPPRGRSLHSGAAAQAAWRPAHSPRAPADEEGPEAIPSAPAGRAAAPRGEPRYPALDAVRGLAALAVVAFHAYKDLAGRPAWDTPLGTFVLSFQWAVPVFFVLSGFLLYRPFAAAIAAGEGRPAAVPFLVRRAARIFPAYWLALVLFGTLAKPGELWTPDGLVRYGLLLQVFDANTVYHVLGTAWSLSIEVAFYLALPVLAWFVARLAGRPPGALRHLAVIAGLTIAAICLRNEVVAPLFGAAGGDPNLAGFTLAGSFTPFAGGMALAVLTVSRRPLLRSVRRAPRLVRRATAGLLRMEAPWLALALVAYSLGLTLEARHIGPWSSTDFAALAAVGLIAPLVLRPATSGIARWLGGSGALVGLGAVSYGLYLWHWPIQELARTHGFAVESSLAGWAFGFATTASLGLVAAIASFRLVETPINRWVRGRVGGTGATSRGAVGGLESGAAASPIEPDERAADRTRERRGGRRRAGGRPSRRAAGLES